MTGIGFCVPPLARTYWNMGPGPDYADTDHGKEWSAATAKTWPTTSITSPGRSAKTPYRRSKSSRKSQVLETLPATFIQ